LWLLILSASADADFPKLFIFFQAFGEVTDEVLKPSKKEVSGRALTSVDSCDSR